MSDAWIWPIGLGLLGAIVGSFVAALVIRWPQGRSVMRGRSACDGCGRTLGARELVPIVSAMALRGRCSTCGSRIDPRHWQIEVTAALIGAAAGLAAPTPVAVGGAAFGWLLLALAALDVAALWLPDRLTAPLLIAGLAFGLPPTAFDRAIGAVAGFALLAVVAIGYKRMRGRDGLGWGDPKLLAGIGAWLGWRMIPAVLLIASLAGLALVVLAMARGRVVARATPVPLGALLAIAAYPAWLAMIASAP